MQLQFNHSQGSFSIHINIHVVRLSFDYSGQYRLSDCLWIALDNILFMLAMLDYTCCHIVSEDWTPIYVIGQCGLHPG